MAKKKGPAVSGTPSPNLIPMIDIMFLLLLFFMLGADMSQRELEEVILPHAKSVKEDKGGEEVGKKRLTINVYHKYRSANFICPAVERGDVCRDVKHWLIGVRGKDFTDLEKLRAFLDKDAAEFRTDPKNPTISERKVMIRADAAAPYGRVQVVMNTCTKVGIYKIECGAAQPPSDKKSASH